MSDLIETSDALGEPIELYRFSYGQGAANVITYTDSDFEVSFDSRTYVPAYIERGAVNAADTLDKAEMEITVAEDSEIAELFAAYPPSEVVGLTVFRCHWDEALQDITTPMAIWVGRVLNASREDFDAKLRCEPAITSLRRVGLRRHWQYMCPHVLYGSACQALRANHTIQTTANAFDARSITVPGLIDDGYRGGLVSWTPLGKNTERRTVLTILQNPNGTSQLVVGGAIRDLEVGMALELSRGCKHTIADCRDVFDNAPNFGGQPYIPTKNPHGTTSIYN